MGHTDLKVDVTRGTIWKPRNLRMETLKNSPHKATAPYNEAVMSSSCSSSVSHRTISTNSDNYECKNRMDLELFLAARRRDMDSVDALLDVLERVSSKKNLPLSDLLDQLSPTGNTVLHLCVIHENIEGAAFIAYHFPTLLARQNSRGDTAFDLAARAGDTGIVETLVEIKDRLTPTDIRVNSLSPVHWYNSLRLRNMEGNMPLHEALIYGHTKDVVCSLIRSDPKVLNFVNDKEESPLYLAAKTGEADLVAEIFLREKKENADGSLTGKSAVHAALLMRKQDVLEILLDREPRLILLRDEEGRTPLHLAASLGYLEEVKYLLGINIDTVFERDNTGLLPIHLASIKGHISLVWLLLQYWPDPCELLCSKGRNILHVAVMSGGHNMARYILGTAEFEKLINMSDKDGNTPLHVAAMSWHPRVVRTLTWDKRVDLKLVNTEGKTALDCAEYYMKTAPSFRMRLTWAALKSGSVPRAFSNSIVENMGLQYSKQSDYSDIARYRDTNTILLVATLVATITFAAGFTMPGGYNNSNPDQGMATMLKSKSFHLFVISDTIAMYSSIIVSVALIWAQLWDLNLVLTAFPLALPLLGFSLLMMSLSFVAGVCLVVSKLRWLAISVLVTRFIILILLASLFVSLCFPFSKNHRILRYITDYPFSLLILLSKRYN